LSGSPGIGVGRLPWLVSGRSSSPAQRIYKYKLRKHHYWRLVESRRINGKPHAIPLLHLGSADALLDRLLHAPEPKGT